MRNLRFRTIKTMTITLLLMFTFTATTPLSSAVDWSSDIQLIFVPEAWDEMPSVMQASDGTIWVVWASDREGFQNEVFYTTSSDNGVSWSDDTQLTFDTQKFDRTPSVIQAADGSIWVVWSSGSDKKADDVYYKTSLDYGVTWSESIQLTSDAKDDTGPSIVNIYPRRIWVVWASYRTYDFEIFYKISDEIPIHDVAVTSVAPQVTSVFRDEIVPISVVVENQGTENENLEVSCYANSTLIGTQTVTLTNGTSTTLDFFWNTEDAAFGTYIISANASTVSPETVANSADNTFVDSEVHVKLLGDVNGDGSVDASDLFDLSKAYGSELGDPNWDPDCDFNWDNKVDASDLFDLSKNYGQTV